MKNIIHRSLLLLALSLSLTAGYAHTHEKKVAGPNGGRVIDAIQPRAEFFVTADRKVQITFIDDEGEVVAPAEQVVIVTTGDRAAPTKLTFAKSGDTLISHVALPDGHNLPTVVQITPAPDAKTVTKKFNLNLSKCPECKNAEYACVCGH